MTGDYVLSIASIMISRLKNDDVTLILSQVSRRHYDLFFFFFFNKFSFNCCMICSNKSNI